MIRGLLLDLSGVLYVGGTALPGAVAAVQRLMKSTLPVRYVTNTTRSTATTILQQLAAMGFAVEADQVFTAPQAARRYLAEHHLHPYLLIHPNLHAEFKEPAPGAADSVLLGDAGTDFTYERLNQAFRILIDGGVLVAMGRNRYFQETGGLSLDAGPFVTALEDAADARAVVTGKPAPEFFHAAVADLGCRPDETLMVGDDLEADVLGALDAGLQAALVRTGKYREGDDQRLHGTAAQVFDDLPAVVEWLLRDR